MQANKQLSAWKVELCDGMYFTKFFQEGSPTRWTVHQDNTRLQELEK